MPSSRVTAPTLVANLFDIIGTDGAKHGFISHAGLCSRAGEHDRDAVAVIDMCPPLRMAGHMKADAKGVTQLNNDEFRKIKDYVDRHEGEHQAAQKVNRGNIAALYCIVPHATPFYEEDGRYVRMRFSCAGFVYEA